MLMQNVLVLLFALLSSQNAIKAYEFPPHVRRDDIGREPGWQVLADHFILTVETPGDSGSGFVIASPQKDVYVIVTAKHVVNNVADTEEIVLKDNRGNNHTLRGTNISYLDPNYDLAFIKFRTENCYLPVALSTTLGIQEKNLQLPARVVGFSLIDPAISDLPIARHAKGEINVVLPDGRGKQGYEIGYGAATTRQMSGSPVFISYSTNNAGTISVGAMHGRGERDETRSDAKSGYNFGIPSRYIYKSAIKSGLKEKDLKNTFMFTENPMHTQYGSGEYAYRLSWLDRKNTDILCSATSSRLTKDRTN